MGSLIEHKQYDINIISLSQEQERLNETLESQKAKQEDVSGFLQIQRVQKINHWL